MRIVNYNNMRSEMLFQKMRFVKYITQGEFSLENIHLFWSYNNSQNLNNYDGWEVGIEKSPIYKNVPPEEIVQDVRYQLQDILPILEKTTFSFSEGIATLTYKNIEHLYDMNTGTYLGQQV